MPLCPHRRVRWAATLCRCPRRAATPCPHRRVRWAASVGSLALPVPPASRHGEKRPLACVSTPAEYFVQHGHIVTATERAARVKAAQDLYMVGEARGWTPAVPAERNQTVAYFAVTYSKGHLDSARTAVGAWELFCQEEGLPPWPADWVRVCLFLQAVRALHDNKAGDNNRGTAGTSRLEGLRVAQDLINAPFLAALQRKEISAAAIAPEASARRKEFNLPVSLMLILEDFALGKHFIAARPGRTPPTDDAHPDGVGARFVGLLLVGSSRGLGSPHAHHGRLRPATLPRRCSRRRVHKHGR